MRAKFCDAQWAVSTIGILAQPYLPFSAIVSFGQLLTWLKSQSVGFASVQVSSRGRSSGFADGIAVPVGCEIRKGLFGVVFGVLLGVTVGVVIKSPPPLPHAAPGQLPLSCHRLAQGPYPR